MSKEVSSSSQPDPYYSPEAERIFADFLLRLELGEQADIDSTCAAHPRQAHELREMYADYVKFEGVRSNLGFSESLAGISVLARPSRTIELEDGGPVRVEDIEDSASRVSERITRRAHPWLRYEFKGEVGRGGMGAILRARDEDLRRDIVIKIARPGRNVDRFLEEAQIAAQLDHPGIVPVHELSLDDAGRLYFTMKLVKGRELRKVFDLVWNGEEGWTLARAVRVLLRVCEAVAYAHDKRVIHRDLKPQNIMVGRFGEVFVMDWGLARVLGKRREKEPEPEHEPSFHTTYVRSDRNELAEAEPDSPFVTIEGAAVGTPAYMSPEQAQGKRADLTVTTDVYAVGAMLYQLLTQQMPFISPGEVITSQDVLNRVRNDDPRPIRQLASDVPRGLITICEKAMARVPTERHASMMELADDLAEWLDARAPGGVAGTMRVGRPQTSKRRSWRQMSVGQLANLLIIGALLAYSVTATTLYAKEKFSSDKQEETAPPPSETGQQQPEAEDQE